MSRELSTRKKKGTAAFSSRPKIASDPRNPLTSCCRMCAIDMRTERKKAGFVLIELVATIILVGIIGTFTGFFLYTGMEGYLRSKQSSEGALRAQIALDRIKKELRDINRLPANPVANVSLTYESGDPALQGQRRISFAADTISLDIDTGSGWTSHTLLDGVESFELSWVEEDLDKDGANEISRITIAFAINGIGRPFPATVYLRNFFPAP